MAESAGAGSGGWRTIDALAALVGAYSWIEHRIFEVTGGWATGPGTVDEEVSELRVWSAATSRRHGALAGRWAERLPVRAGVEAEALVAAPTGPEGLAGAFEELAAMKALTEGVSALVEIVLPWVGRVYGSHLAAAHPASEASVMEVLVEARREGSAEIAGGRSLLERLPEPTKLPGQRTEAFKRVFVRESVSPAVRPG